MAKAAQGWHPARPSRTRSVGRSVKSCPSCKSVQVNLSTSEPAGAGAAFWVEVVALAAAWLGLLGDASVATWVREVRAWLAGGGSLEGVCVAASRSERLDAWSVAWAIRAATCAAVVEARSSGRWPLWRAIPYRLSGYVHPVGLAREVLELAGERGEVEPAEVSRRWRELAVAHGVVP